MVFLGSPRLFKSMIIKLSLLQMIKATRMPEASDPSLSVVYHDLYDASALPSADEFASLIE